MERRKFLTAAGIVTAAAAAPSAAIAAISTRLDQPTLTGPDPPDNNTIATATTDDLTRAQRGEFCPRFQTFLDSCTAGKYPRRCTHCHLTPCVHCGHPLCAPHPEQGVCPSHPVRALRVTDLPFHGIDEAVAARLHKLSEAQNRAVAWWEYEKRRSRSVKSPPTTASLLKCIELTDKIVLLANAYGFGVLWRSPRYRARSYPRFYTLPVEQRAILAEWRRRWWQEQRQGDKT